MSRFTSNDLAFFLTYRLGAQGVLERKTAPLREGKGFYFSGS